MMQSTYSTASPLCLFFFFISIFLTSRAPGFLIIYFSFSYRLIDLESIFFTSLHFTLSRLFPQTNHTLMQKITSVSQLLCPADKTVFYTMHYHKVIIFVNTITMFPNNQCSVFDFTYNYTEPVAIISHRGFEWPWKPCGLLGPSPQFNSSGVLPHRSSIPASSLCS